VHDIRPPQAFSTYVPYDEIENRFLIPMFGSRAMLRSEERNAPKNQYYLLEKAGIRQPKKFRGPEEIDTLAIVKVQEAKRKDRAGVLHRHRRNGLPEEGGGEGR